MARMFSRLALVLILASPLMAGNKPKPPDAETLAKGIAVEANKLLSTEPEPDATDADRDRLANDIQAKLNDLSQSLVSKEIAVSGLVLDVVASGKIGEKITDAPLVATIQTALPPSPELVAEWKREFDEKSKFWDERIKSFRGNAYMVSANRDQKVKDVQEQQLEQKKPELVIQIAGTDGDFKGWKRQQRKSIGVTVLRASVTYGAWACQFDAPPNGRQGRIEFSTSDYKEAYKATQRERPRPAIDPRVAGDRKASHTTYFLYVKRITIVVSAAPAS